MITVAEAKGVIEQAKRELPSWECVMNSAYSNEAIREAVLFNLLKMFYRASESRAEIMRQPNESFEAKIGQFVLDATGGAWFPSRSEIDDVVEAALAQRKSMSR